MRKILYIITRVISIILVIPPLVIGIPSLIMMMISDELGSDPHNLNRK
jgi:hypothetical protein